MYLQPLLRLHSSTQDSWNISILIVAKKDSLPIWMTKNSTKLKMTLWKLLHQDKLDKEVFFYQSNIEIKLQDSKSVVNLEFSYDNISITRNLNLPAINQMPYSTYSSCNGFSSASIANKWKTKKNAMWETLNILNIQRPYELMLMGGDQIYADAVLASSEFYGWSQKSESEQINTKFTKKMEEQAQKFYLDWYIKSWSETTFSNLMTKIPSIMIWDDHDIIDGWGSYSNDLQSSPVQQGLYKYAERYFCLFQQHRLPQIPLSISDNTDYKGDFYNFGSSVGLLVLDLRSERNYNQIISRKTWEHIFITTEKQIKDNKLQHLLIMSSIPLAHPDFSLIEKTLGFIPSSQELEDDLHDHWASREHSDERKYFIRKILFWAREYNCRITILSGDVHIAANGLIQSTRTDADKNARSINQITSSGIVHPPPPALVVFALNKLMENSWEIERDITIQMLKMPNSQRNFISARNFISMQQVEKQDISLYWHVEGETYPYKKWIRVVEPTK